MVAPGPFAVDYLRLSSPASRPPLASGPSGHVVAAGTAGRGSYDHVRVSVSHPSWLVLGEGYNRGWPDMIAQDPAVVDKVSRRWQEYGL